MTGFIEVTSVGDDAQRMTVSTGHIVYFTSALMRGQTVTKLVLAHADIEVISTKHVYVVENYETVRSLINAAAR